MVGLDSPVLAHAWCENGLCNASSRACRRRDDDCVRVRAGVFRHKDVFAPDVRCDFPEFGGASWSTSSTVFATKRRHAVNTSLRC